MSEEDEIIVVLDSEMEVVVESQKNAVLGVYEDLDALILQAEQIDVPLDDEDKYNEAVELKRTIKATHIAINKKEKELKAPLLLMKSKLGEFVKTIYNPLKDAEKVVKRKTDAYEDEQKRLKAEKKSALENEGKEREILDAKLHELNATLVKINEAKTVGEVEAIEKMLGEIDLKSFGDRSDEAGFLVGNLTMTCNMAKKGLPVGEPVIGEEIKGGEEIKSSSPVNGQEGEQVDNAKSESKPIETIKEAVAKKTEFTQRIKEGENVGKVATDLGMTIATPLEEEKEVIQAEVKEQPMDGELDFGAVADTQANAPESNGEQKEEEIKKVFFSPEKVEELLKNNSVLPMAVYEGGKEEDVSEIITVCGINKAHPNGLPDGLKVMIQYPNGSVIYGTYKLTDTEKKN